MKTTSLACTNPFATNKLSLLSIAGGISPIDVVGLVAGEEEAVITIAIPVVGVVRLLMVAPFPPSGQVPRTAVGPCPVPFLELVCSSNPDVP